VTAGGHRGGGILLESDKNGLADSDSDVVVHSVRVSVPSVEKGLEWIAATVFDNLSVKK
jgi:2C-methyl-D-erythritol 2,4-cyclodiphosphate synthase